MMRANFNGEFNMQRLWSQLGNISQPATPAHKQMRRSAVVKCGTVSAKQGGRFETSDRSSYCARNSNANFNDKNILGGLPTEARRQQLNT